MSEEFLRQQLRQRLNSEKIKLWELPYTNSDGGKGEKPIELIIRYSIELQISQDQVEKVLEELRLHALEKLAARQKIKLKVRPTGKIPHESATGSFTVTADVHQPAVILRQDISQHLHITSECLKLVANGRVLNNNQLIGEQGLKNDNTVMAICLSQSSEVLRQENSVNENVHRTRQAAELLSRQLDHDSSFDNYRVSITDQSGNTVKLPLETQKALTLAMTLHEKGRLSIKKRQFGEALLLLLEADKEFSKCDASLLTSVDNYALVCLDIVWCYLCLESINDLADAKRRLEQCEQCFLRSYGVNLERVASVKGNTSTERALFVRLRLLQGIVAFHENRFAEARKLLNQAETDLNQLHVSEEKMTQVMSMGFSGVDARLALRACGGDVERAVQHIIRSKEEEEERKLKEKRERKLQTELQALGKTADGQKINVESYDQLISMGFKKGTAAEALRQANNDIIHALQLINDTPELLTLPDPETFEITDEMLSQVTSMGFEMEAVKAALYHFRGNLRRATEELLQYSGIVPEEWLRTFQTHIQQTLHPSGATNVLSTPLINEDEQELLDSVLPEIKSQHREDYLDLALDDEAQYLVEYKLRLPT